MSEKIYQLIEEVDLYLRKRYNYKKKVAYRGLSPLTIKAEMKKFEIYLRYFDENNDYPNGTIVIARINFLRQRKGEGTMFLRFLYEISTKFNIQRVEVEETNEESAAFSEKLGFRKKPNSNNYEIDIQKLGFELEKR